MAKMAFFNSFRTASRNLKFLVEIALDNANNIHFYGLKLIGNFLR